MAIGAAGNEDKLISKRSEGEANGGRGSVEMYVVKVGGAAGGGLGQGAVGFARRGGEMNHRWPWE